MTIIKDDEQYAHDDCIILANIICEFDNILSTKRKKVLNLSDKKQLLSIVNKMKTKIEELGLNPLRKLSANQLIALSGSTNLTRGRIFRIKTYRESL